MYKCFLLFVCVLTAVRCTAAPDSVTAAASTRYANPSCIERLFIGKNYRDVWSQPVRVKVFRLDKEKGGLTITKLGGGLQTKSLRMVDKTGRKWVLRTIDKTVEKALEKEGIKSGIARNVTQDMISAAQPYGAITVPPMAKALGVITTGPELVFVPDDPNFGEHQAIFANTMCLFEQLEPVLHPGDEVQDTEDMLADLQKHPEYRLDRKMLLQARLLDMLIGDWDRHGGQWKWGYHKERGAMTIYPIPVDHDQAYFNSTGLLVPMVRPFAMKHIIGFRGADSKLTALNRKEWDFDHALLGSLTEEDWRSGLRIFQQRLSDEVLRTAVRRLPPEVHASSGQKLFDRLKERRDSMLEEGMKYYRFLQGHTPSEKDIANKG